MREEPRVSSFEPRRLREAVRKLERLERRLGRERVGGAELPAKPSERPPGLLLRWWRLLFGSR
jgi:hypothetical protein